MIEKNKSRFIVYDFIVFDDAKIRIYYYSTKLFQGIMLPFVICSVHPIIEHSPRQVGIGIENLQKRRTGKRNLQVGPKVDDFFQLLTPSGILVYLVEKKMLAAHQSEPLGDINQV